MQGAWNEIIMQATWTDNASGGVETWYKVAGASTWTQSSNVTGIPTVQYDISKGAPYSGYTDLTEAYTSALSAPLSVSLADAVTGPTFASTASQMP